MNWLYKGKPLTRLPDDVTDFVYIIYYTNGKKYIGKKTAKSLRKKHLGKKELALITDKRLKKHKYVMTEHKWQAYEGSTALSEDLTIKCKHIVHMTIDKRTATWLEVKELVQAEVLTSDEYLNNNISGTFFENCEEGIYKG